MECNKDEAVRAKSIAERKLEQKDFVGAKKFALKAQSLYPGLDGIPQILTVLDVYVSAENKIGGLVDWYGVLGVNPFADDDLIKKQYRKLALMLHPDKNKAIGADGAFKLISEAWSLLSDKMKRMAYNQQRGFRIFQPKPPVHTSGPSPPTQARTHTSVPPTQSRAHPGVPSTQAPMNTGGPSATSEENQFKFACWKTSAPKSKRKISKEPPAARPSPSQVPGPDPSLPQQRSDAFWTVCKRCKIHYEYLLVYLEKFLLCPTCNEPFLASRADLPVNYSKSSRVVPWNPELRKINSTSDNLPTQNGSGLEKNAAGAKKSGLGQAGINSSKIANSQQAPVSGTTANIGKKDPSITEKAANVVHRAQDTTKKPHSAKAVNVAPQAQGKTKRPQTEKTANAAHETQGTTKRPPIDKAANVVHQARGIKRPHPGSHASAEREGPTKKRKPDDDNSKYGMKLKMDQGNSGFKTSKASGSKVYGFSGTYPQQNKTRDLTPEESRKMLVEKAKKEVAKNLSKLKSVKIAAAVDKEKHRKSIESAKGTMMSVPDPDFFDFDQDRTEGAFSDNEVWSAYDDADSMPRFYALINKVISRSPLKLRLSWLNSKTNSEFSSIDWVRSGFIKTCGEFRIGKYETFKSLYGFSQKVNWLKGPNGCILILPQKGDVWALYQNWSPDWNENTPAEIIHKYDMVMVIDDYSEEHGVSVSPLEKVVGFKTVFRPNIAPEVIRRIPKEEMFRFSHQVPKHLLTGQEGQNAPKGCLELDPAAMSLELLQMTAETKGAAVITDTNNMQSIPIASVDEIVDLTTEPTAVKC